MFPLLLKDERSYAQEGEIPLILLRSMLLIPEPYMAQEKEFFITNLISNSEHFLTFARDLLLRFSIYLILFNWTDYKIGHA